MKQLTIDPEFKALIPPLSADELEQLRLNMEADGCRNPLVVWGDTILDGHNRYAICLRQHLDFETVEKKFSDRDEAMAWIIRNQFGRRNLNPAQRAELALKLKPLIAEQAKANVLAAQESSPKRSGKAPQNSAEPIKPIETREELAKAAGVSRDTIAKVETVLAHAPEPVKEAMRTGEKSVHAAYRETKSAMEPKAAPSTNGHKPQQAAQPDEPKLLGKGIFLANEAIDVLKRIPRGDALRARGFEMVATWIKNNR